MLVDSHCHLDFPDLSENLDQILLRMTENQVHSALCISVTMAEFPRVLALAEGDPRLWASVGVHPDNAADVAPSLQELVSLAAHPRVIAIGETGLDYYRTGDDVPWQRERFRVHIRAARESGLPLVIHTRAAAADTLRLMREEGADQAGGVLHCFTETWETAKAALDMGFYISFSGIVTFKNAKDIQAVASKVPADRILVETDSPYLAPTPFRGKTNEPAFVKHVAQKVAELRDMPFEALAEITTNNFYRLFSGASRPVS